LSGTGNGRGRPHPVVRPTPGGQLGSNRDAGLSTTNGNGLAPLGGACIPHRTDRVAPWERARGPPMMSS